MTAESEKLDLGFAVWFCISLLCGFGLATVPQLILDPIIVSHVRFTVRHYPYAPWLIAIAIAMSIGAWLLARSSRNRLTLVSFVMALGLAIPIFPPEVPHMNLVASGVMWLMVAAIWQWLHGMLALPSLIARLQSDRETLQFYVKEEAGFCAKLLLGGIAALLGVVVTALLGLHTANALVVTSPSDRFLLDTFSNIQVTLLAAYWILGPMREIVVRRALLLEQLAPVNKESGPR